MKWFFVLIVSALFFSGGAASAASLALTDCDADGCQGSTLSMEVVENGTTFQVTYTIDTTLYTGDELGINQVGFLSVKDWTGVSLVAGPNAGWSEPVQAPINANSLCSNTKGKSSKACTYGFVDVKTTPGEYTWTFEFEGGYVLPTSDWHFGAQYADGAGKAAGHIISTSPAPIPEPTSIVLMIAGGLIVGTAVRRKV